MATAIGQDERAKQWWCRFKKGFVEELDRVGPNHVCTLWHRGSDDRGKSGRTQLYEELLPTVAESLGLAYSAEVLGKVDHVMSSRDDDAAGVPEIIIESEEVWSSASVRELPKLCVFSAPLRVLLTCEKWDSWPNGGGRREQILREWEPIIEKHAKHWPHPGMLATIVGQWRGHDESGNDLRHGTITYYARAYDGYGKLCDGTPTDDVTIYCRRFKKEMGGGYYRE